MPMRSPVASPSSAPMKGRSSPAPRCRSTAASTCIDGARVAGNGLIKRSVNLFGHATSISLEPVFWRALKRAADEEGLPLNTLVARIDEARTRSEEHTSELQSLMRISYAVFCLKKKKTALYNITHPIKPQQHPTSNTHSTTPN